MSQVDDVASPGDEPEWHEGWSPRPEDDGDDGSTVRKVLPPVVGLAALAVALGWWWRRRRR